MSIMSSKFTVSDVTGVNNAVQHLTELEHRMKTSEFKFKTQDSENIDRIVEALQELQFERSHVHDNLETETINASVIRSKLQALPGQIRAEIAAAVASARESNATELTRLQEKLKAINENIEYLEKRHNDLEQENANLHPERDSVRKEHENIIVQLNQRMAEKASQQIVLNETRDKLRTTNQKIVDLEDSIMQLKEDLVQERADARMEKRRLKKAVFDSTLKTREQKEANVHKKKEVDTVHENVQQSEHELDNIRKTIRRFETSKARMEGQERALKEQLNREKRANEQLKVKGEEIGQKTVIEQAEWERQKIGLDDEITELDKEIAKQEAKNEKLSTKKETLVEDLQTKMKIKRTDEKRVRDTNMRLQAMKGELAEKAEKIGELSQENVDMEYKMEEIADQHRAIMSTMAKQIEEAREQLSNERRDRMDMQTKREAVTTQVDDVKTESGKLMVDMNKRIRDGKTQHEQLSREGTDLQKKIKETDEGIKTFTEELEHQSSQYSELKERYELEIKSIQEDISSMDEELGEKKTQVEEKLPTFENLEKEFEDMNKQYEVVKKGIVAKKNQKLSLEDQVKRIKFQLSKLANPKERIEAESKQLRGQLLQQMRTQAVEVRDIEEKVYVVGCKLKRVLEENDRFTRANTKMEKDIENMHEEMDTNLRLMGKLQEEDSEIRGVLAVDWDEDRAMQQQFADKDIVLVESLGELLEKTGDREAIISNITNKLQGELGILTSFLDNVGNCRPEQILPKKKPNTKDALAIVADANPAPPTPSQFSASPRPTLPGASVIPPITPEPPMENSAGLNSSKKKTLRGGNLTSRSNKPSKN